MGRRRVTLEKIQNQTHRLVTFSKRRKGLLQKSAELCLMCNAQLALVVFSSSGKAFSFGHPSVESVFHYYLNGIVPAVGLVSNENKTQACIIENLKECLKALQKKKSQGTEKISNLNDWIEKKCAEYQSVEELQSLRNLVIAVKEKVEDRVAKLPTNDAHLVTYQDYDSLDDLIDISLLPSMPDSLNGFDSKVSDVHPIAKFNPSSDDEFLQNFEFDKDSPTDFYANGLEGLLPPMFCSSAATNFGVGEAGPSTVCVSSTDDGGSD